MTLSTIGAESDSPPFLGHQASPALDVDTESCGELALKLIIGSHGNTSTEQN